jgi:hypothetical protein
MWGLPSSLRDRGFFRKDFEAHLASISIVRPPLFPSKPAHGPFIYEDYYPSPLPQNYEAINGLPLDNDEYLNHHANHKLPQHISHVSLGQVPSANPLHGFCSQVISPKFSETSTEHQIRQPTQYLDDYANSGFPVMHGIPQLVSQGKDTQARAGLWSKVGINYEQNTPDNQAGGYISNAAVPQVPSNSRIIASLDVHFQEDRTHDFADQSQVNSQPRNITIPFQELDTTMNISDSIHYGSYGNKAERGFDSAPQHLDFNNSSIQSEVYQRQQNTAVLEALLSPNQPTSQRRFPQFANQRLQSTSTNNKDENTSSEPHSKLSSLPNIRGRQLPQVFVKLPDQSLDVDAFVPVFEDSELLKHNWQDTLFTLPPDPKSRQGMSQQKVKPGVVLADTYNTTSPIDVTSNTASTPIQMWMDKGNVDAYPAGNAEVDRKHLTGSSHLLQYQEVSFTRPDYLPATPQVGELPSVDSDSWDWNKFDEDTYRNCANGSTNFTPTLSTLVSSPVNGELHAFTDKSASQNSRNALTPLMITLDGNAQTPPLRLHLHSPQTISSSSQQSGTPHSRLPGSPSHILSSDCTGAHSGTSFQSMSEALFTIQENGNEPQNLREYGNYANGLNIHEDVAGGEPWFD